MTDKLLASFSAEIGARGPGLLWENELTMKLRDCIICGHPVMAKQHQADSARACSPVCARTLAMREHPDLERRSDREDRELLS